MEELTTAQWLADLWVKGGWGMYPIAALGMLALVASFVLPLIATLTRRLRFTAVAASLLLVVGLVLVALGWLFQQQGLGVAAEAIAHVNPDDREIIWLAAQSEARVCLIFGLLTAAWPVAAGAGLAAQRIAGRVDLLTTGAAVLVAIGVLGLGSRLVSAQETQRETDEINAFVDATARAEAFAALERDPTRPAALAGAGAAALVAGVVLAGVARTRKSGANAGARPGVVS